MLLELNSYSTPALTVNWHYRRDVNCPTPAGQDSASLTAALCWCGFVAARPLSLLFARAPALGQKLLKDPVGEQHATAGEADTAGVFCQQSL